MSCDDFSQKEITTARDRYVSQNVGSLTNVPILQRKATAGVIGWEKEVKVVHRSRAFVQDGEHILQKKALLIIQPGVSISLSDHSAKQSSKLFGQEVRACWASQAG